MSKLISQKQGIFSYISNSKSFNFLITAMPDFLEVQLKSKPKYHSETALHICPYNKLSNRCELNFVLDIL